jgi:glycosyltransferase involved in cell wall biosynthesis
MNLLMMTNTYLPHVGGVANSVDLYTKQMRKLGHHVIVVSPHFEGEPENEEDVIRIPAVQQIKGSEFSMILPVPGFLDAKLKDFKPDIVHSHHPFFVGSVAVRISSKYNVPLVFTQHTMYEHYTHYTPSIPRMKAFLINLVTGYANMANLVIAPSESIAEIIRNYGVTVPIEVIPTGVDTEKYRFGDGRKIRTQMNIPENAFVIGYTGRIEPEKNMIFLANAIAEFLLKNAKGHFLIVGYGTMEEQLREMFYFKALESRIHFTGKMTGQEVIDSYHAMDVFAFASKTETQGMVLAEAMAAGVPVVAIEAPGSREVIENGINGFLVKDENIELFADALFKMSQLPDENKKDFQIAAKNTAEEFSISKFTAKITDVYERLIKLKDTKFVRDESMWRNAIEQIKAEWNLLANFTSSVSDALYKGNPK